MLDLVIELIGLNYDLSYYGITEISLSRVRELGLGMIQGAFEGLCGLLLVNLSVLIEFMIGS